jgi:23S rRNA (guanosine2251-2'-O)-methyltransferase
VRRWEAGPEPGSRRHEERPSRPGDRRSGGGQPGHRPEREPSQRRRWSQDATQGRSAERPVRDDRRPPGPATHGTHSGDAWPARPRDAQRPDRPAPPDHPDRPASGRVRPQGPDGGARPYRRPPGARPPAGRLPVRRAWVPATPDDVASPEHIAEDEELVAGRRPVEEAFTARRPARRLLVVPERRAALEQLVLHATALRIPVVEVEGGSLTALSGFDGHQGVALVVEPRRWATIEDVLVRARARGEPPFVLVLDSLEDPQNVGTLLRSAEACGVHGVVFPTRRSAPIGPAAIKASAGAVEHLLLVPLDDLGGGLVDLHASGLRLVGADETAPLAYRDADMRGPLALVVGSEGRGIAGHVRRRLDLVVRIPMHGRIGSLNAAVAGSVVLFEAAAQRLVPVPGGPGAIPGGSPTGDDVPGPTRAAVVDVGVVEADEGSAPIVDTPSSDDPAPADELLPGEPD